MRTRTCAFACLSVWTAAAAGVALVWEPAPARACGGLVCDGGGPFNQVSVDQANERVLFVSTDDGAAGTLLTVVIQIQYEGNAADFAWILPVPEVPENVDVAPATFFDELDAATAPAFQFNFVFPSGGPAACSVFGCSCSAPRSASDSGAGGWGGGGGASPVNVWGTGAVGPYEMAIISSDTVDPLVEWIWRHGYQAPAEFVTIADEYVKDNYKFVVVRLAPDAGVNQLAPLVLSYHEEAPCVPLRLTSIAAVPDMGVRVYLVGPSRAVPLNYGAAAPDWAKLGVSPGGVTDYDTLVAGEIERAGGKAWVTEFAGPVESAIANAATGAAVTDPEVLALLGEGSWITRLYTKISPWEMDEDPFFQFDPNGVPVNNLHVETIDRTFGAGMAGSGTAALAGDALLLAGIAGVLLVRRLRARRA